MFDVRFMTDSVFERVIRIVQLGSMVGFVVVGSKFDTDKPLDPNFDWFQPLCLLYQAPLSDIWTDLKHEGLILMTVRLSLAAQYCSRYWLNCQASRRDTTAVKPKHGWRPLLFAAAVHFVAAVVYFGISFRFGNSQDHISRAHIVWYIGSALEAILQLALAYVFDNGVLTFDHSKLTERLAVFTVVVLGEAVSAITKAIILVVENRNGWSVFISAVATTYFLFLLYFDWMDHEQLYGFQKMVYSILHFPFHAALLLFGIGTALFLKWIQMFNVYVNVLGKMIYELDGTITQIANWTVSDLKANNSSTKSAAVADHLKDFMLEFDKLYPIKFPKTFQEVTEIYNEVGTFPDSFWNSPLGTLDMRLERRWYNLSDKFVSEMIASVAFSFDIAEPSPDDKKEGQLSAKGFGYNPESALDRTVTRVETTARIPMNTPVPIHICIGWHHTGAHGLHARSYFPLPDRGRSEYIRIGLFLSVGLGLGLLPLMSLNEYHSTDYFTSPWVLPTICLAVFFVLVVTHVHRPQWMRRFTSGWRLRKKQGRPADDYNTLQNHSREDDQDDGNGQGDNARLPA
ncbi:hypothetical protein PG993_010855 [Apiospora rasikravindrae]|uniref:Uncharacterized protein n=1 Tax=Apiospora rasikravindrae TaxID=990691 RepID=A0ABR1SEA9_9PEZI